MIFVDTSVVLAEVLAEDRRPPIQFWHRNLVASRLLEYEVWTRVNAKDLRDSHGEHAGRLIASLALVELAPQALERALKPFPRSVRTLDALHLATMDYLRRHAQDVTLASYDERMNQAASALGFQLLDLD